METSYQGQERRRAYRVKPALGNPLRIEFYRNNRKISSERIRDISVGGIAFLLPSSADLPEIGERIDQISLFLPRESPLALSGLVRRVEPDIGLCAMELVDMETSVERRIVNYVNRRQRELSWVKAEKRLDK